MTGREHAERILSRQTEDSEQRRWQIRKSEILRFGIPVFWSHLCDYLKTQVQDFNSTLNVTEDWGLHFFSCESYLTITKKSSPVFILKAAVIPGERVKIETQAFGISRTSLEPERYCVFDVSKHNHETIELDGSGFYQFGTDLFSKTDAWF